MQTARQSDPRCHSSAGDLDGTGIVIDAGGLILTNHHVVGDDNELLVRLPEGAWVSASVVGTDPQSDLAVIRTARPAKSIAELGDAADLRPGQPLAALGYPEGNVHRAVTLTGRLSRRSRSLQGALDPAQRRFYGNLIESTIPIPPGCSGGPLLDGEGRVVGINTAVAVDPQTGRKLGYAIPMSARIRSIIARLGRGETIGHGYVGLLVRAESVARAGEARGARVERTITGSPAHQAGIQAGDIIIRVDGRPIRNGGELAEAIRGAADGRPIELHLLRNGRPAALTVTPSARPNGRHPTSSGY